MLIRYFSLAMAASAFCLACGPSGDPPQVQALEDRIVGVSEELVVRIDASDPDGDSLIYTFETDVPEIRSRSAMTQLPIGAGEFRWTPMAADVGIWYFDFKVSDGDYTTTVTMEVDVRSAVGANSSPRFLKPASNGTVLDLSEDRCLNLEIEILDADSVEVELAQAEPLIDGATLEQSAALGGTWKWCPTPEQINAGSNYTVSLSADDGENPPTVLRYFLYLRRPEKPGCTGDPPEVVHAPMDQTTLGHVVVTATVTDDKGIKDAPLVFYSEMQPAAAPNLSAMGLAPMTELSADTWTANLPNPVAASAVGTSANLYYLILARDGCDFETVSPAQNSYEIEVTNPGGFGGLAPCETCAADAQCGDSAEDLCVLVGTGGVGFCLQECAGQADCPSGTTCSVDPVDSVEGAAGRQCIPDDESCGLTCIDDEFENNDSLAQAATKDPLAPGVIVGISCPLSEADDDEDWWQIDIAEESSVSFELDGGEATDLDILLYFDDGVFLAGSSDFGSYEEFSACLPPGSYFVRVLAYNVGANDYQLTYDATPMSCSAATCTDLGPEDNDDASEATAASFDVDGIFDFPGQTICSLDEDWYEFTAFDGESITALIDFAHADGDLDLGLYAGDGATIIDASESESDGELISWTLADPSCPTGGSPCTLYLAVVGYDGAENDYDLLLEVVP